MRRKLQNRVKAKTRLAQHQAKGVIHTTVWPFLEAEAAENVRTELYGNRA